MTLSRAEMIELLELEQEIQRRIDTRKIYSYYPDEGPLRRELYTKHTAFFEAGDSYRERLMLAANRVGKTEGVGGYETALHLLGEYPSWWKGRRFHRPVKAWAAGDTSQTVRDIIQMKLLGPPGAIGTGLIPSERIIQVRPKAGGVPDAIETVMVSHASGGASRLIFKSYDQKRKSFQGTEQDLIWLDEEPPIDIYSECLLRTMTTNGLVMCTFTPLQGLSETVLSFLPGGRVPDRPQAENGKFIISATWDDAPHLTKAQKEELWASIPPYQRDARSKGIPQLGSGAIFPISEDEILVNDFELPVFWPRCFGMDVGWNWTAAAWLAHDRETDIVYVTGNYKRGHAEPSVHVASIQARGDWIPGVIDPASQGSSQVDGRKLSDLYAGLGLNLQYADNAVEAGIHQIWLRMSTGRFKVFRSCQDWLQEFRLYRRDEDGKIVKENDHLMDCTRYAVRSGLTIAQAMPYENAYGDYSYDTDTVDEATGY